MSARQTISLVAGREIRERLRSRVFLYSTLLMLGVIAAGSALPTLIDTTKTYHVAVVASAPPGLDAALERAAKPFHARVKLQALRAKPAREQLRTNRVDLVSDAAQNRR